MLLDKLPLIKMIDTELSLLEIKSFIKIKHFSLAAAKRSEVLV